MKEEFMNMKKLYHYTKFDTAIKILESHSLRFGRLHNMNDIHENDKLSYVDTKGTLINSFPSDVLDAIDCEMAKYRQISLTADDDKKGKLGFDLHQMWGFMPKKAKESASYLTRTYYANKLMMPFCTKLYRTTPL